jgi:uncharacterized protein YfaS (alpha-2-macroglobulin family)
MPTDTISLNNGVQMPVIGLGVFQTPPDETRDAVEEALRVGYRHIDTAAAYANEREVGEGIRRSGVARDEVFVETKVWISDYGYDATLHAFDKSAAKLGVDQLDLLILHQALPSAFDRTLDAYRASLALADTPGVRATYEDLRAKRGFRILDYRVDSDSASPRICFQFSEALAAGRIDFAPFVAVSGAANAAVTAEGQQLCVDGLRHGQKYAIVLRQGLPSAVDEATGPRT